MDRRNHGEASNLRTHHDAHSSTSTAESRQNSTTKLPPIQNSNSKAGGKADSGAKRKLSASYVSRNSPSVVYKTIDSEIQILEVTKTDCRLDMTSTVDDGEGSSQPAHAWKRKKRRNSARDLCSAPLVKVRYMGEETLCAEDFLSAVLSLFLTIFLCIPISLLILLTLPMALLVKTLGTACSHPRLPGCCNYEYLSAHDAYYYSQTSQSILHSVIVIDGMLPLARIRQVVASRVVEAKNASGDLLFRRFTDHVEKLPAGPAWIQDESFHIHHHIYLGPRLSTKEELQKYVSDLMSKPLSLARPLWEVIVVGGGDQGGVKDTILVCRVHPCIADGISLMRVLCQALSDNHMQHLPSKTHFGGTAYTTNMMQSFFTAPLTLIKWLFWWPEENNLLTRSHYFASQHQHDAMTNHSQTISANTCQPKSSKIRLQDRDRRSSINEGYIVKWSASIPLSKVTRVKLVTRTCLNDVLLTALAGALRKTLQKRGLDNPPDLKVSETR